MDRFKKGWLCVEVVILERVIDNLKDEYEVIIEYLKIIIVVYGYIELLKIVDVYM